MTDATEVAALRIDDLTVTYDGRPALWNIDLEIPQGVLMALVGPNGAGKSTLLRAVMDLVPRSAGSVEVLGSRWRTARGSVAYVPQRGSVDWDFPTNVLDVVMMGMYGQLGWLRRPGRAHRDRALAALADVQLADLAHRQISRLSGGQQQRAFLARALVQDASLYLMDEPFAAVDAVTERAIVTILRRLKERGRTVIVVHHDLQTVPDYFDWVTLLNVEVQANGPVESAFTRDLIGRTYGAASKGLPFAADGVAERST